MNIITFIVSIKLEIVLSNIYISTHFSVLNIKNKIRN